MNRCHAVPMCLRQMPLLIYFFISFSPFFAADAKLHSGCYTRLRRYR